MSFENYIIENDITSLRKRIEIKKLNITHSSHDVWKDKQDKEYKWNDKNKKFQEYKVNNWDKAKEIAEKLAEYLKSKISDNFTKRENKIGGPDRYDITFNLKNTYLKTYYSISVVPDNLDIYLDFNNEKEISSESLADRTKNYLTTTARKVKTEKKRLRKIANETNVYKEIDKFFSKLS